MDVVADGLDEGGLFHDQAEGQFDEHLRAAGFGRVDAAVGPIDGLAGFDEFAGLLAGELARIAEPGEDVLVFIEVFDGGLVGDGEYDLVAAFFGLADLPEFRAGRGFGECLEIAVDVLGVGQLAGFPRDASEEFERRRDCIGCRHVVHKLGGDARVLQVFFDEPGVFFVDLLRGGRGGRGRGFGFSGLAENGAGDESESEQRASESRAEWHG